MRQEIPQIDPSLWLRLKIEAKHRGLEVSELLREAVQQFLGLSVKNKLPQKISNLDRLAGTWNAEDAAAFEKNTQAFGEIDQEMWK